MKFDPIPDLKRGDGDTVVTVVGFNSVPYRTPVDDPFFTAHVPRDTFGYNTNNTRANFTTYNADNGLRAMGCLQQVSFIYPVCTDANHVKYQFCHSVKSKPQFCTTLGGLPGDATPELFPDANDIQLAVLKLLVTSSISFDKANGAPLLAEGLTDPEGFVTKYAISNEHWKKEVTWVESTVWAALQTAIADYAAGPQVRDPASDWVKPASRGEKELCGMQKMRKSGGIVNINVLGLILVVSVAGLVTIIDISLLRFLIFLTRFRTALAPRIDRWIQDGVWQLQRRAYEAQGYAWVDLEGEIPLTAPNEQLKDLPVMWLPAKAMANIALGIGVPPRLETKQSTFSLRSPATWSSKSVKSVSGWLWREKSAEELGVGTAPEIRR
jgi:hypothetical protein